MSRRAVEILKNNYNKLGELDDKQFLAVKAVTQGVIYAREIDMDHIMRRDNLGIDRQIHPEEIQAGDTITLNATVRNALGTKEQSGSLTIEDVRDAQFSPITGQLVIDSDKFCLSSIDCTQEIADLALLINAPNVWVTKAALSEMVPSDATLKDFQEVRDLMKEKEYGRVAPEMIKEDRFTSVADAKEIDLPQLLF